MHLDGETFNCTVQKMPRVNPLVLLYSFSPRPACKKLGAPTPNSSWQARYSFLALPIFSGHSTLKYGTPSTPHHTFTSTHLIVAFIQKLIALAEISLLPVPYSLTLCFVSVCGSLHLSLYHFLNVIKFPADLHTSPEYIKYICSGSSAQCISILICIIPQNISKTIGSTVKRPMVNTKCQWWPASHNQFDIRSWSLVHCPEYATNVSLPSCWKRHLKRVEHSSSPPL